MVGGVNAPDMAAATGDAPMGGIGGDIPHANPMAPPSAPTLKLPSVGANLPSMDEPVSPMGDEDDMEIDFGMDKDIPRGLAGPKESAPVGGNTDERPYNNSPHEIYKGPKAAVPSGNDLARPKLTAPKVAGGDNPTHVAVSFD